MKIRLLAAAFAVSVALGLSGCSRMAEGYSTAQGSVGVSHDDALLFAADPDSDQLLIFDTVGEKLAGTVKVGRQPEKVLVGRDDTVYVTNRLGRSVSVIRAGEFTEATRLATGVEPVGLAISSDDKTLYVVSSTSRKSSAFGTLTAFDTATLTAKWELNVGHEPRGIALLEGNRALISLFKDGDVTLVDLSTVSVIKNGTDLFTRLNTSNLGSSGGGAPSKEPFPSGGFGAATNRARGVEALTVSPDGRQVYAAARLSSDAVLPSNPLATGPDCVDTNCSSPPPPGKGGGGDGYGGGSCGATAVSSPAVFTFDDQAEPLVSDVINCMPSDIARPPMLISSGNPNLPVQGPTAAVVDPTGAFLYVVNRESSNVAVVATSQQAFQAAPQQAFDSRGGVGFVGAGTTRAIANVGSASGGGPTGIALARDGRRAWVYNSFDHSISRLESVPGVHGAPSTLREVKNTKLIDDVLPPDVVAGRRLFFSTTDNRMNNLATGIGCGTCHLDGREDGHVWNFSEGPRQTPSLAGRMTAKTAPFHWGGEFASLTDFMSHTVTGRMGGQGVTPEMERQLTAFITSIPAADNPYRFAERTEAQLRGGAVFTQAGCNTCHAGEALTDNKFANVGTLVTTGAVLDDAVRLAAGLNTPSLLGLARSAPYLHDGSVTTLKERILRGKAGNLHGTTAALTDGEVDDLVAFLQTL